MIEQSVTLLLRFLNFYEHGNDDEEEILSLAQQYPLQVTNQTDGTTKTVYIGYNQNLKNL